MLLSITRLTGVKLSHLHTLIPIFIVVSIIIYVLQDAFPTPEPVPQGRGILQVAVINTQLSHDEVIVPLVDAWLDVPSSSVKIYQAGYRFGMESLLQQQGFPKSMTQDVHVGEFHNIGKDAKHPLPDILVATTCMDDIKVLEDSFTMLLEQHHTHLFCVVHHADRLQEERWLMETALSPWIRAGRIDFITLSPHVADSSLRYRLDPYWKVVTEEHHHPPFRIFAPVFNYLPQTPEDAVGSGRQAGYSIQGEYQRGRDYTTVFNHLRHFIQNAEDRGESISETNLHLVGFGKHPAVPKDLQKHVIFDERLDYIDFYTTLMQTEAVLTAFDSEEYYLLKASSSVPASLIAGTPLIANEKLLQAYSYLDESVVWKQSDDESELDVVGRVLALSRHERDEKKRLVREFTNELIMKNRREVKEWTAKAVENFPGG